MSERPTDPALLREEIERTREELVDTITRLRGKADQARRLPIAVLAASGVGVLILVILLLRKR